MKPIIPFSARLAAWWHETIIGHRVTKTYWRGKYKRMECRTCSHTFHHDW